MTARRGDRAAVLLDANVLIPLVVTGHEFAPAAQRWFAKTSRTAICPIVEGALARFLVRTGERPHTVREAIAAVRAAGVEFWPDSVSYADVDLAGIRGHRQVTDSYLLALADSHGARLATFDTALAARSAAVELIDSDR
ncbi:MAG: PIN domain-containing protein [Dermatophilaceae bacterium]